MRGRIVRSTVVLYSALLVGPVVPLAVGDNRSWGLLVVGCIAGAVVGGLATVGKEMTAPDASWPLGVAGLVVPLGWFLPALGEPSTQAALLSTWAVGVSASVAWLLVVVAVGAFCNSERLEDARAVVEFSARRPKTQRRHLAIALAVITGTGFVLTVGIGILGSGFEWSTLLPLTITPVFFATLDDETDVTVADTGLIVDNAVHEWEGFEGYEVDDGVLSVVSDGLGTQKFDAGDIEDIEAVTDALDRQLPRLDP